MTKKRPLKKGRSAPAVKPKPKPAPEPARIAVDIPGLASDALPPEAKDREAADKLAADSGGREGAPRPDAGRPPETDTDRRPPGSDKRPDLEFSEMSIDAVDAWNLYAMFKRPRWVLKDPERDQLSKKLSPVLAKYLPDSIVNNTPEISLGLTLMAIVRSRLKVPDLKSLFRKPEPKPAPGSEPSGPKPVAPGVEPDWREYGARKFQEAAAGVSD